MIQVSTHLFGSTEGYQTLAQSADVSEVEARALSIFGFGSPKSIEEIEKLNHHPSVAGRLLPSGRFAITRLFSGEPDVAGRATVERRTLIFSAHDWKYIVRCDIESLLTDKNAFDREVIANSGSHSVLVNDSEDLLPCVGELERRLYDILLSTPRQNACALLVDDLANRRGLMQLLKLLPINEACHLSWGLGLFAATPGVRIATASASVGANPHACWPSMSANLAHPEKVALLGVQDDAKITANKLNLGVANRTRNTGWIDMVVKYLPWIILGFAILVLGLVFAAYKFRANNQSASQQTNLPTQPVSAPPQPSSKTPTQPSVTEEKPIATAPATSIATAPATSIATAPATSIATAPATSIATAPATNETKSNEPVNLLDADLELWKQANATLLSIQSPTISSDININWLQSNTTQAEVLLGLQEKIIVQVKQINFTKSDVINLNLKNQLTDDPKQDKQICRVGILVLAQCEIIAAKLELNKQLASSTNKSLTAEWKKKQGHLDDVLKKIEMHDSMSKWITPKNQPNATVRQSLDPKLRELFKKTYPDLIQSLPSPP